MHSRIRSGIVGLRDMSEAADCFSMDMGIDPWVRHVIVTDGGERKLDIYGTGLSSVRRNFSIQFSPK